MKRLAIVGASGHGKVVADIAQSCGWAVSLFDDGVPADEAVAAWKVIGTVLDLKQSMSEFHGFVVAVGDNKLRMKLMTDLENGGGIPATLIHPASTVSQFADIGPGSVVMAGAIVNVDAQVGRCCIINTGATVDHDCLLGDGVHLSPGANLAGGVRVGEESWVGIGAAVKQRITIGKYCVVGAGAAVIYDICDSTIVGGVPAVQLR